MNLKKNITENATSNTKMQKLARQELKRQRAEVNKFFDELERKMDDEILTIEKRNKDALKAASDRLEPMKKDLDQIKNDIETKKTGQHCELFISMKKSKEKMRHFQDQFNKMQDEISIQQYTLFPSEQIQAMMRTTSEICRIQTSRITTVSATSEISRKPTSRTRTKISRTTTARYESVIEIQTSNDKTKPNVYSLTIIHGHYCVVVDGENKSIKVVDTKRKCVISEIGIEAQFIWSVTPVSDEQVVVSLISLNRQSLIQFFSVSVAGDIQKSNQVHNVDEYYRDMVYCKGYIYGVCGIHTKIDIFSMKGKIIRKINLDANLFSSLYKIALNPDREIIYVTDGMKHSVTSLILDGKLMAIYTGKDLKDPWGITVDKHGYGYVRSWGTHNIKQLTADLNKVQVLIEEVHGKNITYSSTENKLYTDAYHNIYEYTLDFE